MALLEHTFRWRHTHLHTFGWPSARRLCANSHCCDLETIVSRLVHSSSFCSGLGLGLETWRSRSRSWSQDSVLGAYACSTITIICSTFKRVLCHQLELMQPVLWSRDHDLETRVHSSSFCSGLNLGLETWWPRSQSWSRDLKKVSTTTLHLRYKKTRNWNFYSVMQSWRQRRWTCVWTSCPGSLIGNAASSVNCTMLLSYTGMSSSLLMQRGNPNSGSSKIKVTHLTIQIMKHKLLLSRGAEIDRCP